MKQVFALVALDGHSTIVDPRKQLRMTSKLKSIPHEIPHTYFDRPLAIENSQSQDWIAERNGAPFARVRLDPTGRFRVTNMAGRRIGTFRSLAQVRHFLQDAQDRTLWQRITKSRAMVFVTLSTLVATVGLAAVGGALLLH